MTATSSVKQGAAQLEVLLAARDIVSEEQLEEAREIAEERGRSLGRVLIELGYLKEGDLVAILAGQLGLEFVDLSEVSIDPSVLTFVPEILARKHNCIPVRIDTDDGRLVIAMADPANVVAVDDIRALSKKEVRTIVATKADVQGAINRNYRLDSAAESLVEEASAEAKEREDLDAAATASAEDAPIIKLVNLLITQAGNYPIPGTPIGTGGRRL